MRKYYLFGGLVLLVIVITSAILGFTVIKNRQKQPDGGQSADNTSVTPPGAKPPWVSTLGENEKEIFNIPLTITSDEDREKYSALLIKNALPSDKLHISSACRPIPLVFAVTKPEYKVEIKNDDSQNHTIYLAKDENYMVEAGKSVVINVDSKKGLNINYGCDLYGTVGFLTIPL